MRMQQQSRRGHPASFTLIELLIVISIIAILVSLSMAAVMRILGKGPVIQTRSEIAQLEGALATAMNQLGNGTTNYLPSSLRLREDGQYTMANANNNATVYASYQVTVRILTVLFGKSCIGQQIDWNGDGAINTAAGTAGDYVLEGEECLVFFLGGIPSAPASTPGCLGFSNNPANPAAIGGTRLGPYYTAFASNRLVRSTRAGAPPNFLVYRDAYGKIPYAYFSNYGAGNDYQTMNISDCASLGVVPYYTVSGTGANAVKNFVNPKGFQIVSAGADYQFGPGGGSTWTPVNGYGNTGPGADDQANFASGVLGVGGN